MKGGDSPNGVRLVEQFLTALHLRLFQFIKAAKVAIGDPFVGQGPEPLAGLQFGRVRRQKDEMQPLWNDELRAAVPPCSVEHKRNAFVFIGPNASGKLFQGQVHDGDVHPRQEQPNGSSRERMHEGVDIHPLITRLHEDTRARSFPNPDAAQQRFETDAVLIKSPQFDEGFRMILLDLGYLDRKFFLKASCSSGSAFA